MASNYNIMANYIVSKYIERVSGKDLGETFVDDDPSKRVMVGFQRIELKLSLKVDMLRTQIHDLTVFLLSAFLLL